jgi:hypothetical protein
MREFAPDSIRNGSGVYHKRRGISDADAVLAIAAADRRAGKRLSPADKAIEYQAWVRKRESAV